MFYTFRIIISFHHRNVQHQTKQNTKKEETCQSKEIACIRIYDKSLRESRACWPYRLGYKILISSLPNLHGILVCLFCFIRIYTYPTIYNLLAQILNTVIRNFILLRGVINRLRNVNLIYIYILYKSKSVMFICN